MNRKRFSLMGTVLGLLWMAGAVNAEPEAAAGEGRELFVARCSSCHSLDYVEMHARFGTRALWESQIAKMRNAYKAPMSDEDAKVILAYLERQYGPKPAAAVR